MLKNVLYLLAGAAIGAGTAYFFTKRKYEMECQEEINKIKEDVKKFHVDTEKPDIHSVVKDYADCIEKCKEEIPVTPWGPEEKAPEVVPWEQGIVMEKKQKQKEAERKAPEMVSYSSKFNKELEAAEADEPEEDDDDEEDSVHGNSDFSDAPYTISEEEFAEVRGYEKETLIYYEGDDVVINEDEEDITVEAPALLGVGFRSTFGMYTDNVSYIRNEKHGTDYEIIKCKGCYYHEEEDAN